MNIRINVTKKHPSVEGSPVIVCGNSGYIMHFTFDNEWADHPVKTVRLVYIQDGEVKYTDIIMSGASIAVPIMENIREVFVGVYAGDLKTTTPVKIPCERSIRCDTGDPVDPTPSQYDQIMDLLNDVIAGGSGIPEYEGTDLGAKCAEFSALMRSADKVESFVFFTDPHLAEGSGYEAQLQEYLETIKNYYHGVPASFVVCGGDWIGNMDTQDTACFKLGYIDGLMRRHFDKYHMVVGNHDTNEQGCDDSGERWTGVLPVETVRNLWNRENGANYYSFDGANTKFYVLDTWQEGSMTSYHWEQIAWLAERLQTDDAENSALFLHEAFTANSGSPVLRTFTSNVLTLCQAYNDKTSVTLNGVSYDFSDCEGSVRFALSGHIHSDYTETVNGIPVITTSHLKANGIPTFELCLIDYENDNLNLVRVGTGENRVISMSDLKPYVVLLGYSHRYERSYIHPRADLSSIVAKKGQYYLLESTYMGGCDGGESGYYYFDNTEDVISVRVNCPSDVVWGIREVTSDALDEYGGYATSTDRGTFQNGQSYAINPNVLAYVIVWKMSAGGDIPSDFDVSTITVDMIKKPDTNDYEVVAGMNVDGSSGLRWFNGYRMGLLTTKDTGMRWAWYTGTNGVQYYCAAIPSGATKVKVTCPGFKFGFWECQSNPKGNAERATDSGWKESGSEVTLDGKYNYYSVLFERLTGTLWETEEAANNYDTSGVKVEFS